MKPRVAFFGCSRQGTARIVRVGVNDAREHPQTVDVDCPVCGTTHLTDLLWRPCVPGDDEQPPELVISADGSAAQAPVTEKRCTRCHTLKPVDEFSHNSANPDGRVYRCRKCYREARDEKADAALAAS